MAGIGHSGMSVKYIQCGRFAPGGLVNPDPFTERRVHGVQVEIRARFFSIADSIWDATDHD